MTQKSGSLLGKHAGSDGDAMIHSRMIEYSEAGAHRAAFRILRAIHQAVDARLQHSPRAHGARLDGYVERNFRQSVISRGGGCRPQRNHFCMSGGVAIGDGAVRGARNHPFTLGNHTAHGHFSRLRRHTRFFEGESHVRLVECSLCVRVPGTIHRASE